jgi:hypothetical protein
MGREKRTIEVPLSSKRTDDCDTWRGRLDFGTASGCFGRAWGRGRGARVCPRGGWGSTRLVSREQGRLGRGARLRARGAGRLGRRSRAGRRPVGFLAACARESKREERE